jgi:peptide/nickel transport system substrate-binding protein
VYDLNQLYAVYGDPYPDWLTDTVYQSLVTTNESAQYGQGVIQYLPGLAQNWTVSPDGSTYTFNLRQGVTFSSGDAFNSYQVWLQMYGLYYLTANSSAWLESYSLFNMSSSNFGPATIALINQSGLINPSQQALNIMMNSSWPIYVTSPYQIVFHMDSPFSYLPGTLLVNDGLLFDTQWLLDHGGFGNPTTFNSYFNQNPIPGTGPYVVTTVSENNYVEFTQNPSYWGDKLTPAQIALQPLFDPGHVKNVIIYAKLDDVARYADLTSAAVQIAAIRSSDWNLIQANPQKFSFFTNPAWGGLVSALGLNTQIYPTNITAVRQAIVHSLNYTDIAQKAFLGEMSSYVGPEYPAWQSFYDLGNFSQYSYNTTLATQLLSQANVTSPTLTMNIASSCSFCTNLAEAVQSDLSVVGINVQINVEGPTLFYTPYGSYSSEIPVASQIGNLVAYFGSWAPGTLTPADYWETFVSNESLIGNTAIYYNPTVQAAVNAFTTSTNATYIQGLVAKAQAQIYSDAPYAWLGVPKLWYSDGSLVWQKGVISGFEVDPVWSGMDTAPIFNTVTFG